MPTDPATVTAELVRLIVNSAAQILLWALPFVAGYAALKLRDWLAYRVGAELAGVVVRAAEQVYATNQQRLDYAVTELTEMLKRRGINLPVSEIMALVEAAVFELPPSGKQ